MKIIKRLSILFLSFFITNTLFASEQCAAEDNRVLTYLRILESINTEISHYYLQRNFVFPSFSHNFWKREARWGDEQLRNGLSQQALLDMQRKRYTTIYFKINQQFREQYLYKPDALLQEWERDSEFKVILKYEQLLSPLIEKQLKTYNDDLLRELEGENSSEKN